MRLTRADREGYPVVTLIPYSQVRGEVNSTTFGPEEPSSNPFDTPPYTAFDEAVEEISHRSHNREIEELSFHSQSRHTREVDSEHVSVSSPCSIQGDRSDDRLSDAAADHHRRPAIGNQRTEERSIFEIDIIETFRNAGSDLHNDNNAHSQYFHQALLDDVENDTNCLLVDGQPSSIDLNSNTKPNGVENSNDSNLNKLNDDDISGFEECRSETSEEVKSMEALIHMTDPLGLDSGQDTTVTDHEDLVKQNRHQLLHSSTSDASTGESSSNLSNPKARAEFPSNPKVNSYDSTSESRTDESGSDISITKAWTAAQLNTKVKPYDSTSESRTGESNSDLSIPKSRNESHSNPSVQGRLVRHHSAHLLVESTTEPSSPEMLTPIDVMAQNELIFSFDVKHPAELYSTGSTDSETWSRMEALGKESHVALSSPKSFPGYGHTTKACLTESTSDSSCIELESNQNESNANSLTSQYSIVSKYLNRVHRPSESSSTETDISIPLESHQELSTTIYSLAIKTTERDIDQTKTYCMKHIPQNKTSQLTSHNETKHITENSSNGSREYEPLVEINSADVGSVISEHTGNNLMSYNFQSNLLNTNYTRNNTESYEPEGRESAALFKAAESRVLPPQITPSKESDFHAIVMLFSELNRTSGESVEHKDQTSGIGTCQVRRQRRAVRQLQMPAVNKDIKPLLMIELPKIKIECSETVKVQHLEQGTWR